MRRSVAWLQRGWSTVGFTFAVEAVLAAAPPGSSVVGGWRSVKRISTIDLMPLKPYFHGTTSRSGAPFWLGSTLP